MGNGYAISAVIGKRDVMGAAEETFISSTFWTERVGFAAALAATKKIVDKCVWNDLGRTGELIGSGWERLAAKHGLKLKTTDVLPLITFKLDYGTDNNSLYTLFTQEMLKRGFLATNSVYVSYAHKKQDVERYLGDVDKAFFVMARALSKGTVNKALSTSPRCDGFKRLT
jgi:glutamate-1-semialdehyde aminotransferase